MCAPGQDLLHGEEPPPPQTAEIGSGFPILGKKKSGPDFLDLVSQFVQGLSLPSAPSDTAGGVAPPAGLRQAQLKAQALGVRQLAGSNAPNPLSLPDF